jgi:hypothetical protein
MIHDPRRKKIVAAHRCTPSRATDCSLRKAVSDPGYDDSDSNLTRYRLSGHCHGPAYVLLLPFY